MKGRFIVIEGIDGCGKTTQINHLANWLPNSGLIPKGNKLHITREPGGTKLGESIRDLLLKKNSQIAPTELSELLLYCADRSQHIAQIIKPALRNGDWVISDRYSGSTLAYQGYGRMINIELINKLEEIATSKLIPDVTIWLNINVTESLRRRKNQIDDRIESEGISFMERVGEGFAKISQQRSWIEIEANQDINCINQIIEEKLTAYFKNSA